MKKRTGFVSNSSSSSFILHKKMKKEDFTRDIRVIWKQLHCESPEEVSKENLKEISFFFSPKEMSKKASKPIILKAYDDECWDANGKVIPFRWEENLIYKIKKFFSPTYMDEALKAEVFGTSQENQIPYLVLETLKKKYGDDLTIHHLG